MRSSTGLSTVASQARGCGFKSLIPCFFPVHFPTIFSFFLVVLLPLAHIHVHKHSYACHTHTHTHHHHHHLHHYHHLLQHHPTTARHTCLYMHHIYCYTDTTNTATQCNLQCTPMRTSVNVLVGIGKNTTSVSCR